MSESLGRAVSSKIPGEMPKSPPEQHVENLSKLTKVQLQEIKQRQEKLLANKSWIKKLPDKGKRIQDFHEKVCKELSQRDDIERAADLFSDLNIATNGQQKLVNLEWTGRCELSNGDGVLDSDDEETDPLKIIAQSTNVKKKIVTQILPEKSLITEEDMKEIESFTAEKITEAVVPAEIVAIDVKQKINAIKPKLEEMLKGSMSSKDSSSASLNIEPHVLYLIEKNVDHMPHTERFKPYKTTKTNVHDPEKEVMRNPSSRKTWEVTAATPPSIQHPGVKMLHLQDSVEIQTEYLEKLQKLREQQAEERLRVRAERFKSLGLAPPGKDVAKVPQFFMNYRDTQKIDSSDSSESEEEQMDSDEGVRDEEEERGGVNYVVYK